MTETGHNIIPNKKLESARQMRTEHKKEREGAPPPLSREMQEFIGRYPGIVAGRQPGANIRDEDLAILGELAERNPAYW